MSIELNRGAGVTTTQLVFVASAAGASALISAVLAIYWKPAADGSSSIA